VRGSDISKQGAGAMVVAGDGWWRGRSGSTGAAGKQGHGATRTRVDGPNGGADAAPASRAWKREREVRERLGRGERVSARPVLFIEEEGEGERAPGERDGRRRRHQWPLR
jgi:hypothetical protein